MKARLAGLEALCSADPFPVIIVGDGENDTIQQKLKYVNDRDKEISQDLNPRFYRSYELDASFPEDWKLEIQLYDKGALSYTDGLIGSTIIDLEDRLFGNFRRKTIDALNIYKEMTQAEIRREEKKETEDHKKS